MSHIKILPEHVINRISAGEVIEKPASVVKELIENSIDAGSTEITLLSYNVWEKGFTLIDDGSGMTKEDALLAIKRHATSKIETEKDIYGISTLGFRGEALPSIASVSNFTIETKTSAQELGTKIVINGGSIVETKPCSCEKGTKITIKDLFYNTPVRKKFLKSERYESQNVIDIFSKTALSFPQISWKLYVDNKLKLHFPKQSKLSDKILNFLPKECQTEMLEILSTGIAGMMSKPSCTRSNASQILTYVNKRLVHDKIFISAVLEGYGDTLMRGRYPVVVLFLEVPPDSVDVNIHPTKKEVKFENPSEIYKMVNGAIKQTIAAKYLIKSSSQAMYIPKPSIKKFSPMASLSQTDFLNVTHKNDTGIRPNEEIVSGGFFSRMKLHGIFANCYILLSSDDQKFYIIDQHAAHERILFEKFKLVSKNKNPISQMLLIPETIELSAAQTEIMSSVRETLKNIGYDIEDFGTNTFILRAVPEILSKYNNSDLIKTLGEELSHKKNIIEQQLFEILAERACKAAIKANMFQEELETRWLLKQMDGIDNPEHCPHGRPTFICYTTSEISKLFKRT